MNKTVAFIIVGLFVALVLGSMFVVLLKSKYAETYTCFYDKEPNNRETYKYYCYNTTQNTGTFYNQLCKLCYYNGHGPITSIENKQFNVT